MSRTMLSIAGALVLAAHADAQTVEALSGLGSGGSIAWGINNNGVIVGESVTPLGSAIHATMWGLDGLAMDLGVVAGATNSTAYAINDLGQTVGYSEFDSGVRTATLFGNSRGNTGPFDIGAAMGAFGSSIAWDINNQGSVVGQAALSPGFSKGFIWSDRDGGMAAGGSTFYQGGANYGINDNGDLVGSGFFFGDPDDAFLSRPDGRGGYFDSDIAPPGYNLSIARDISNTDICVGFTSAGVENGWAAAIFLGRGDVQLLEQLDGYEQSEANAVNDSGLVVGFAFDTDFEMLDSAWAWKDGVLYDLNDYISERAGFTHLLAATDVNNNGDIVGYGLTTDGHLSGFVIRGFVPAPGALGVMLMGAGLAARRRR